MADTVASAKAALYDGSPQKETCTSSESLTGIHLIGSRAIEHDAQPVGLHLPADAFWSLLCRVHDNSL